MGSCQNYGPFLGTLNSRCRIILGTQKGTIILKTTHMEGPGKGLIVRESGCSDRDLRVISQEALCKNITSPDDQTGAMLCKKIVRYS